MKKKETEIEVEMGKNQQEQIEPVKKKRGRPKASETKEISGLSENLEEKKQIEKEEETEKKNSSENLNLEEEMIKDILSQNVTKLKKMAKEYKIENFSGMSKLELINAILIKKGEERGKTYGFGKLDVIGDGNYGFLRNTSIGPDVYVSMSQIKRFFLRNEDIVFGELRIPIGTEKNYGILKVLLVNGDLPEKSLERPYFDDLVPSYPDEKLNLGSGEISSRIIDLISPIGKGQRGLIVAPPKAGKTVLLSTIANDIIKYNPEIDVWILLIDERPEEVTDMMESIDGEVIYSTFDQASSHHVKVAEMVLSRAQRLVEHGKDVVILLDSITRLARAYNLTINPTGRTLTGGLDPGALYGPKKFFGAARNIRNGGSLTILGTALIDTGSRMDDVIFEEFKGTGNMELHLDRNLAEKRIFPAIDVYKSGTRREDLLLTAEEIDALYKLRRSFTNGNNQNISDNIIEEMKKTRDNKEFIEKINQINFK